MGVSHSNTHVANATNSHLRIYYEKTKMELEELVATVEGEVSYSDGVSGKASGSSKMIFKPKTRVSYVRLPAGEYVNFTDQGEIFACVLVEHEYDSECCVNTICMNYYVPSDRSFIVSASENIKLQKYGGNLWVDEDGIDHRRK